ncbi:hypothetical protein [Rosistilla oblonga]|uniref:hypothetical protein n=1 Tax=Rosistilla oblonga TaxID=2527990 RepID=UPI003A971A66
MTYETSKGKLPMLRVTPTPCETCPKGGPEHESDFVLNDRNCRFLVFRQRVLATPWTTLPLPLQDCQILADNMVIAKQHEDLREKRSQLQAFANSSRGK